MWTFVLLVFLMAFIALSVLLFRKLKGERDAHKDALAQDAEDYLAVCQENEQKEEQIQKLRQEGYDERQTHNVVVLLQQHTIADLERQLADAHANLELALDPSAKLTQERARELFVVRDPYPIEGEDQERVHSERPLQGPLRSTEEPAGAL